MNLVKWLIPMAILVAAQVSSAAYKASVICKKKGEGDFKGDVLVGSDRISGNFQITILDFSGQKLSGNVENIVGSSSKDHAGEVWHFGYQPVLINNENYVVSVRVEENGKNNKLEGSVAVIKGSLDAPEAYGSIDGMTCKAE